MMEPMKRLSDAELEIMLVLWSADGPVPSTYIRDHLQKKRTWALSTLMTVLERLAAKQFVHCDRTTRTNLYTAVIQESEYKASESNTFLSKLFGSSVKNLVTSLYEENAISDAELLALRQYLDRIKEE